MCFWKANHNTKVTKKQKDELRPDIDAIINYEIKDGVVYGYLNQYALDNCLYQKAKERTHNFTDKNQWENEKDKRAVSLEDIRKNKHSISIFPIADGEFVSNGDLVLVLGLTDLFFSNYCYDNFISECNTYLCVGIKIYSDYEGFFTNKVEDKRITSIIPENVIKHGDLLFTIKKGKKPEEEKTSTHKIVFEYNMLSKDFLEDIPELSGIEIGSWFVENNSFVKEGEPILEIKELSVFEPRYKTTIKSPYSGILIKEKYYIGKLRKGDHLFTIIEEDSLQEVDDNEINK